MISLLLALSLSRIAAGPTAPMSFFEPAAPLWRLMPRLATACDAPLQVAPTMENQVLCISVRDVSKKELLDRIAVATGGHWRDVGASTLLEPDANLRAAIEERALVKRAARIQEDIDRLAPMAEEELAKRCPDQVDRAAVHCQQRLIHHIVGSIGARAIAAMPMETRIVYSTSPTSMQRQLPAECNKDVAADDAAWEVADRKRRDKARVEIEQNRDQADPSANATLEAPLPRQRQKLDVILTRSCSGRGCGQGQIQLYLEWYDDRGSATGDNAFGLPLPVDSGFDDSGRQIDYDAYCTHLVGAVDPRSLPHGEESISLSRPARQLVSEVSDDGATADRFSPSEEKALFCSPDKVDPLSYPAEWIIDAARARHLQVVASLPDTLFTWCDHAYWDFRGRHKITPGVVFEDLPKLSNTSVTMDSSWFTVSLSNFDKTPFDRRFLAGLATKYFGKVDVNQNNLFELATAGFNQDPLPVFRCWMVCACPALSSLHEDWGLLRICSGIPETVLGSMTRGAVPLSNLGPTKAAEIERYLFNFDYPWGVGLQVDANSPREQKTPHQQDVDESSGGFVPDDYRAEPTEVFPLGLTGAERIFLKISEDAVIRPADDPADAAAGLSPEELGGSSAQIMSDESGKSLVFDYTDDKSWASVQVGSRQSFGFRLTDALGSFFASCFSVPVFDSPRKFTLKTLPKELQDRFDETSKEAKDRADDFLRRERDAQAKTSGP